MEQWTKFQWWLIGVLVTMIFSLLWIVRSNDQLTMQAAIAELKVAQLELRVDARREIAQLREEVHQVQLELSALKARVPREGSP